MQGRIVITGGTGLVGTRLTQHLLLLGYEVGFYTRNPSRRYHNGKVKTFAWDPEQDRIDPAGLDWATALVHLAGENIGERAWSSDRKMAIIQSRTRSTALLAKTLLTLGKTLDVYVGASAIGYYGYNQSSHIITENHSPGQGFQSEVTLLWEDAHQQIAAHTQRMVIPRIGVVLSPDGGALPPMITPIKMHLGAIGTGKQYISWIHIDDLCQILTRALHDETLSGVYNAVAPNPVNNALFSKILAETLGKGIWIPNIPVFPLRLALGEMATLVIDGSRVLPERLQQADHRWLYPELGPALRNLLVPASSI